MPFSFNRPAARRVLIGVLICLAVVPAAVAGSGSGDYLSDVWTSENGLPDDSVTAIAQTPDGYLWVGTYNGLARFDGVRFVTFDPANTPGCAIYTLTAGERCGSTPTTAR